MRSYSSNKSRIVLADQWTDKLGSEALDYYLGCKRGCKLNAYRFALRGILRKSPHGTDKAYAEAVRNIGYFEHCGLQLLQVPAKLQVM